MARRIILQQPITQPIVEEKPLEVVEVVKQAELVETKEKIVPKEPSKPATKPQELANG